MRTKLAQLSILTFAETAITALLFEQRGLPGHPDQGRDEQITAIAEFVSNFIEEAKASLDIAIYDFRLTGLAADRVVSAIENRAKAGVSIRVAYDPTTSPQSMDPGGDRTIITAGAVGKPDDGMNFLSRLEKSVELKAISGYRALMHNKYVIRDALADDAAVLTGSANFTNDAWGLQENCMIGLRSQPLSAYYATDFLQLWSRGKITGSTGYHDTGTVSVHGIPVTIAFTPGESTTVVSEVVRAINAADKRVTIAAMVMSSGPILAAVSEAIDRGVAVVGLYDGPQMDTVLKQWEEAGVGADKANTWMKVAGRLMRKNSTPYSPSSVHNFMHAKIIVADDVVVAGSFNFSNHARGNAENIILMDSAEVAASFHDFVVLAADKYDPTKTIHP